MKSLIKEFLSSDLIPFYSFLFTETLLISFPYDNFNFDGFNTPELRFVSALALASTVYRIVARFALLLPLCVLLSCLLMALAQPGLGAAAAGPGAQLGRVPAAAAGRQLAPPSRRLGDGALPWLPSSLWWERHARSAALWWRRTLDALDGVCMTLLRAVEQTLDLLVYIVCLDWLGDLWTLWLSLDAYAGPRPLRVNCYPKFAVDEFCGDF